MQVTIHEAKTQLSRLIAAVEAGDEVIIARREKPVVRLEKIEPIVIDRMAGFGCLKNEFTQTAIDHVVRNEVADRQVESDFYASDAP